MQISVKFRLNPEYPELQEFWRAADQLDFEAIWVYDHLYGSIEYTEPTFEGWTTLAAMAVVVKKARIGCLVSGVTFRNPAILAKMAVTVDHISGGRLHFGIGAGWLDAEHRGYGIEFPSPGTRIAMLDEAITVIRRLWTEESVSFAGRFYTLEDAICEPKPLQLPHPPIAIGGSEPKILRVVARHADLWNMPGHEGCEQWGAANAELNKACAELNRDPTEIQRSAQVPLYSTMPEQVDEQLAMLPEFERLGCEHMVLAFPVPPTMGLLQRCAELVSDAARPAKA